MAEPEKQNDNVPPEDASGYEKRDATSSGIFIGILFGAILIAVVAWGMNELYVMTREEVVTEQVLQQRDPRIGELRAAEERKLNNYELLDEETGTVRIPIDRAMHLLVERANRP